MKRVLLVLTGFVILGTSAAVITASRTKEERPCYTVEHGPEARACYAAQLEPDAADGLAAMFTAATALAADPISGSHFMVECHEVMHDLGKKLEGRFGPIDLDATPVETCMVGFQHGVAEYRLASLDDDTLAAAGATWCDGQDLSICRHLIGHVGMRRTLEATNLPDLSYASAVCSLPSDPTRPLRDVKLNEFRCLEGAYMEWTLWAMRKDDSSVPNPPQTLCREVRSDSIIASSACFSQVGTLMYGQYPDSTATLQACETTLGDLGPAAVRMCLYSVANVIVSFTENPAPTAARLCQGSYRFECGVGFARSIAANAGDDEAGPACAAILPEAVNECTTSATGPYPFEYETEVASPQPGSGAGGA